MGHSPLRSEKDCLNCGTHVPDRYCPHCGQENIVPRQTFFSLVTHFVSDILHFDGKFWQTLRLLFLRPGFVPREYVSGRRASFVDPIRMYLFSSALFFFVFFSFINIKTLIEGNGNDALVGRDRLGYAAVLLRESYARPADTVLKRRLDRMLDTSYNIGLESENSDSSAVSIQRGGKTYFLHFMHRDSGVGLDSKSDFMSGLMERRLIRERDRAEGDKVRVVAELANIFLHRLPYLLFLSLPLFAGILWLVEWRRRMLYSEHAVFTLYHYILAFIVLTLSFCIDYVEDRTGWEALAWVENALRLYILMYLLLSMKWFYRQGWRRTLLKFAAVNLLGGLALVLLTIVFTALTFLF